MNPFIRYALLTPSAGPKDVIWQLARETCADLTKWGTDILASGMNGKVGAILVEPDYICKDHRDLFSCYYSKKFNVRSSRTTRLHFFDDPSMKLSALTEDPLRFQGNYLGYSVIRPVAERCLGRTVIDPVKIGLVHQDAFCLRTTYHVHLCGRELSVSGFPYTSQDTDATVCAHAALWSLCRYLSERYSVYPEIRPYDLVSMCSANNGRRVPYHGMTYEDYSTILTAFGAHPEILLVRKTHSSPQDRNTYLDVATYVESGFPVLASIGGHVIVLIGHTLDLDANPSADQDGFVDHTDYWKQFVVVDDNAFPYARFGKKTDPCNYHLDFPTAKGLEDIITAVCPLPEKAYLPARMARIKLTKRVRQPEMARLLRQNTSEPLVTRLFLTTSTSLKKRKFMDMQRLGVDPISQLEVSLVLPHFVWVLQVAPVSYYKQGKATGEFVLDSTIGQLEDDGILFARVGNTASIQGQEYGDGTAPLQFPQYTHNLGEHES